MLLCKTLRMLAFKMSQSAESRKDFLHKMKIALKELRETHVWLLMIRRKPLIEPEEKLDPIICECNELSEVVPKSWTRDRRV